jgi:hypothetical protein
MVTETPFRTLLGGDCAGALIAFASAEAEKVGEKREDLSAPGERVCS